MKIQIFWLNERTRDSPLFVGGGYQTRLGCAPECEFLYPNIPIPTLRDEAQVRFMDWKNSIE